MFILLPSFSTWKVRFRKIHTPSYYSQTKERGEPEFTKAHKWDPAGGGGKKLGIFLWRCSSAWKRRESYVNQTVAKNYVNQSLVFVELVIPTNCCTCRMRICKDFSPRWYLCIFRRISYLLTVRRNIDHCGVKYRYINPDFLKRK